MAETTYYSALHYAKKAEKSAQEAAESAASIVDVSGKIIQLGFDGSIDNNVLVFNHAPGGVDAPYVLVDDYEYEIDLAYASTGSLADNIQMRIKNGNDTINFVSAIHRSSTEPATVGDMKAVMGFNSSTGYRWLFKAAFKITPAGAKVFLLYPVIYNDEDVKALQTADAQNVKLTGHQNIRGIKRFKDGHIEVQNTSTSFADSITGQSYINFWTGDNKQTGYINSFLNASTTSTKIAAVGYDDFGKQQAWGLNVVRPLDGSQGYATLDSSPAITDNSTNIATTAWFRNNMQVVSALPSTPTAGVFYFVKE